MLKSREASKILENIVGEDNFSEDPAVLSSYSVQYASEVLGFYSKEEMLSKMHIGAVIMPGTTEEVQAIVKACNKYKISYKAFSTGLGAWGTPRVESALQIDMRRMNRIIKMDEKDMYAVVEPYVSHLELQAELFKRGVTHHVIGCGSQTSILASATSMQGTGHTGVTTSYQGRNVLGEEWVTPTGGIVRWGLVEEGKAGHPGPGLRGIYRGREGAYGALGVFTKVAVKLYPWPGPTELEITGKNPTRGYKIPNNFKIYFLTLSSPEKVADVTYKLVDEEIGYHVWYYPLFIHTQRWVGEARSNDDQYDTWKKIEAAGLIEKSMDTLVAIIAAYSEREFNYKEKVMRDIIEETGATEFLPGFITKDVMERFFAAAILSHKPCTEFRSGSGETGGGWSQFLSLDAFVKGKRPFRKLFRKYVEKGVLNDYGYDTFWSGPEDQKAMVHAEYVSHTNPRNRGLVEEHMKFQKEANELAVKLRIIGSGFRASGETEKNLSKYLGNYFDYKRKIKMALDPNDLSDSSMYLGIGGK